MGSMRARYRIASTSTRCPSTYRGSEVRSRGFLRLISGTTGIVKTLAMKLRCYLRIISCSFLDGVFEYNAASCRMQPETSAVSLLFLVRYNFSLAGCLELEHLGGNFLPELNAGVLC